MLTKLNVLLAKTDHLAGIFKKGLEDYVKFFKGSQGAFRGEKKTYEPRPNTVDHPNERGSKLVVTTVSEKLNYLEESSKEYIDALFAQERTNSTGLATAKLTVNKIVIGEFTSLELLRLKSLLESGPLKALYETLPVRNDDETCNESKGETYKDRDVWESVSRDGVSKSIYKESYILPDPNIANIEDGRYTPQVAVKDTVIELGEYTFQKFSGEMSHTERANILKRRSMLLTAVVEALKMANEVEAVESEMTAAKIFGYLHRGQL